MKRLLALVLLAFAFVPVRSDAASYFSITSSSATSCTSITASARSLLSIWNAAAAAQTVTVSIYDEGASPSCASADLIYSGVLGGAQVITFPPFEQTDNWVKHGLAYTLSAAATNNIIVEWR